MDAFESPFCNLDLWCDWSGDPLDPVGVCMTVEVWCTPDSQINVLDTSHPLVEEISDFTLTPIEKSEDRTASLFSQHSRTQSAEHGESQAHPVSSEKWMRESVTPTNATSPVTPEKQSAHATLHPNIMRNTDHPSDSGSVLRVASTPDGSPGPVLDAFYASFFQGGSSPGYHDADGQSPTNPRKRSAKAASLPDSVTDSERAYGGEKVKALQQASVRGRQSPVSSGSPDSKQSRKSLLPRPVALVGKQARLRSTSTTAPTMSVPTMIAEPEPSVQNFMSEKGSLPDDGLKAEPGRDSAQRFSHVSTTDASPCLKPRTTPNLDKLSQCLNDIESLSTVASVGSSCDMAAMLDPVDASFGEIPTRGDCVENPSPIFAIDQPRLRLTRQVLHIDCSPETKPSWYRVSVSFFLRLETGKVRGWCALVVSGLPGLSATDHGYVYLRIPDGQGLEIRSLHLKRYEIIQGCLIAQFQLLQSQLIIPLRPCDAQFYGFLRDFKVNQTIRNRILGKCSCSGGYQIEYTAICSLDLIQRDFWAEQCGFHVYIHGGPAGEYSCHLDTPLANFQVIQLDGDHDLEVGTTQLRIICALANLNMFVITWRICLPRAEPVSWTPYISTSRDACRVEEDLQARYLYAEDDDFEVVRGESKSRLVALNRFNRGSGLNSIVSWMIVLSVGVICLVILWTSANRDFDDGLGRFNLAAEKWGEHFWNSRLAESKVPAIQRGKQDHEEIGYVCDIPETVMSVGERSPEASHVPESAEDLKLHSQSQATEHQASFDIRDQVDYFLGWRGPVGV
ncbi:hypothetical protein PDE_06693 [Penicillium oxalicum 114-2]|uniref:Uncharacterized protein n=1 Tax=Penicillium oxalicum (strain 114-2 / CGMCC 5302) TaxID=933388 RepID=S7ZSP6_PENO1|nr:hypothetical protein PDE_06693 [Penicillium oxalicum 114-2]